MSWTIMKAKYLVIVKNCIVPTMRAIFMFMMCVMQWINLKLVQDGTEFMQTM